MDNQVPNVNNSGLNVNLVDPDTFAPLPTGGIPNRNADFNQFQPKVTLSWAASDAVNWYASYGVGFRGWIQQRGYERYAERFNSPRAHKSLTTTIKKYRHRSKSVLKRSSWTVAFESTVQMLKTFFEFFAPFGLLRTVTTIMSSRSVALRSMRRLRD